MRVGIPTEIKNNEYRVAITPAGVSELVHRGHEVLIQAGAGEGSAIHDPDFTAAGAAIVQTADEVWEQADLLLKVKGAHRAGVQPDAQGPDVVHLPASGGLQALYGCPAGLGHHLDRLRDRPDRRRRTAPLLAPMSEVAGRLSAHVGAYRLMRTQGGRGVLMGGVPGVAPAVVVVIGGGMAGDNAAAVAWGMGAHVTVFDLNINTLRKIDAEYGGAIETRYSSRLELENAVKQADLVIGAVLVPGAKAPNSSPMPLWHR